jgi:hypothetical protein
MSRRPEEATRAGTAINVRRSVGVVAAASLPPARAPAARVRLTPLPRRPAKRCSRWTSGGQVSECGALQVGVDLLDDGVPAVRLVRGDGVQPAGGEKAWNHHS